MFRPEHVTTRRRAFRDPVGLRSRERSGMEHVVFFVGALLILVVNGPAIVVLSTCRSLTYGDALPSPIIGTCVLSILTTIFVPMGRSGTHYHALCVRRNATSAL